MYIHIHIHIFTYNETLPSRNQQPSQSGWGNAARVCRFPQLDAVNDFDAHTDDLPNTTATAWGSGKKSLNLIIYVQVHTHVYVDVHMYIQRE